MKHSKQDLDAILDNTMRSIREEQIDETAIDSAAKRVWAQVREQSENSSSLDSYSEGINTMNAIHSADRAEHIDGCDDFQSLIPAYLDGKLSAGRKLLLEDHSNECVPCRKELSAQRNAAAMSSSTYVAARHTAKRGWRRSMTAQSRAIITSSRPPMRAWTRRSGCCASTG